MNLAALGRVPALQAALTLLRVWLRRGSRIDCFSAQMEGSTLSSILIHKQAHAANPFACLIQACICSEARDAGFEFPFGRKRCGLLRGRWISAPEAGISTVQPLLL